MFGIKHELTHVEEPKKHAHEETKEGEAGENGQEAHGNAASGQGGKVAPEGVPFIRPDGSILNRGFEYLPIPETTNPTIWTKTKADWRPSFVGKSFYCCCQLCCVAELLEGDRPRVVEVERRDRLLILGALRRECLRARARSSTTGTSASARRTASCSDRCTP